MSLAKHPVSKLSRTNQPRLKTLSKKRRQKTQKIPLEKHRPLKSLFKMLSEHPKAFTKKAGEKMRV
jgi:hypothetical protein